MRKKATVNGEGWLTIGALSRATGVPVETLRTWERRYRYPLAQRKPSGHRRYPLTAVPRLRRAVEAIARGHRAAEVLAASEDTLDQLLSTFEHASLIPERHPAPRARSSASTPVRWRSSSMAAIRDFDALSLHRLLSTAWSKRALVSYLEERIAPLLEEVGRAWHAGKIDVRHEHFASAVLGDFLRERRRSFEGTARGPWVALATLPGDRHEGGLWMVALLFAASGWRVVYLGADTPVDQVVALAQETKLAAVAISVSPTAPEGAARLRELRRHLPRTVPLLVGGAGAPRPIAGAERVTDLGDLNEWIRARGLPEDSPRTR